MPNGRRFSGASGAAEFASSAIAFRGIDSATLQRIGGCPPWNLAGGNKPAARRASSASLTLLLPQWPEEHPNVVSERGRLFHRGEVAAARHDCPTADVRVSALGQ